MTHSFRPERWRSHQDKQKAAAAHSGDSPRPSYNVMRKTEFGHEIVVNVPNTELFFWKNGQNAGPNGMIVSGGGLTHFQTILSRAVVGAKFQGTVKDQRVVHSVSPKEMPGRQVGIEIGLESPKPNFMGVEIARPVVVLDHPYGPNRVHIVFPAKGAAHFFANRPV